MIRRHAEDLGYGDYKALTQPLRTFLKQKQIPKDQFLELPTDQVELLADGFLKKHGPRLWPKGQNGLSYPADKETIAYNIVLLMKQQQLNQKNNLCKKRPAPEDDHVLSDPSKMTDGSYSNGTYSETTSERVNQAGSLSPIGPAFKFPKRAEGSLPDHGALDQSVHTSLESPTYRVNTVSTVRSANPVPALPLYENLVVDPANFHSVQNSYGAESLHGADGDTTNVFISGRTMNNPSTLSLSPRPPLMDLTAPLSPVQDKSALHGPGQSSPSVGASQQSPRSENKPNRPATNGFDHQQNSSTLISATRTAVPIASPRMLNNDHSSTADNEITCRQAGRDSQRSDVDDPQIKRKDSPKRKSELHDEFKQRPIASSETELVSIEVQEKTYQVDASNSFQNLSWIAEHLQCEVFERARDIRKATNEQEKHDAKVSSKQLKSVLTALKQNLDKNSNGSE